MLLFRILLTELRLIKSNQTRMNSKANNCSAAFSDCKDTTKS